VNGKPTVDGQLNVLNEGTAAAAGFTIQYYVSADGGVDQTATEVGKAAIGVGIGQQRNLTFKFHPAGAVSGDYLVAQIKPPQPGADANTGNQVAAIKIP
jgi:hypothetical protein